MLEIEIFSDVVCPWCFIGKRRLDQVLQGELGQGVRLRWRPYQLQPNIAPEGLDRKAYLLRRYGHDADLGRVPAAIAAEARGEGLTLRYDLMQRMPNTLLAHRLMELSFDHGVQHDMAEALFQAYFCAGKDVGDLETLVLLAADLKIPAQTTRDFLNGDGALKEVHDQLERAVDVGVTGVPGYYLPNGYLLPGAQSAETMAQIFRRVKQKLNE